ncbi:phenylalanine--tRNA ligase subunit beta [Culicoidibacter larvae]|uniref:Phenylalanine--tRNA ligase beta subunit n=1 Tax=Culicoidibacter larvae TaxID=2579976 RepID=A0A5R8QGX3_9FIRM|nr:phenylalanine--tRNA ligase subunit beta [Culicoidibacter larvae]TLG76713.1 phenylalanine--tRNA ligase subunit beta [Culicoidibacter larvae]
MLVSRNWLGKYADIKNVSTEELARVLSNYGGLEVEETFPLVKAQGLVVGYIESMEKHPDSDKLNVCQVITGEESSQIVCGAPNVAAGQRVIVARVGATIPGLAIAEREIRGVASNGMICALQELGIDAKYVDEAYRDGIYVLAEDAPIGMDALEYLHLNDEILDISLTPDRADAMSYRGLAYETAASCDTSMSMKEPVVDGHFSSHDYIKDIEIESEHCSAYTATIVRNVTIGTSPYWMQAALIASGMRPINSVVDVANYVMLELGEPLHTFDMDRISSGKIVVRQGLEGEKFVTLDDNEREITPDDIMITDGSDAIALGGVMGGANTEVTSETKTILIEAALFDSTNIRKTGQRLNLRSEASSRFERGVDPNILETALKRAAELLVEISGGEAAYDQYVVRRQDFTPKRIAITLEKIQKTMGVAITGGEVAVILRRLQFEYQQDGDRFVVVQPSRRLDIVIWQDVVEEIARIYGYDRIEAQLPVEQLVPVVPSKIEQMTTLVHTAMQGAGLQEVITYSLVNKAAAELGTHPKAKLQDVTGLMMPLSEERAYMRLNLYASLIETVRYNQARNQERLAIYEVSYIYDAHDDNELYLGLAMTDEAVEHYHPVAANDFYAAKGCVEAVVARFGQVSNLRYEPSTLDILHPGKSADVYYNDTYIGSFGDVHPSVAAAHDINKTVIVQLSLSQLLAANNDSLHTIDYHPVSKFPNISRDLAVSVARTLPVGEIIAAATTAGGEYLLNAEVFDVYEGEHIEADKKSVAFRCHFGSTEKTLTSEEIDAAIAAILEALKKEPVSAVLRG